MNIKKFLIISACKKLPPDLKCYIFKIVEHEAAYLIQRLYIYKVSKNIDIFLKLGEISSIRNNYNFMFIHKFIDYAKNNITYSYIQDPESWVYYLNQLLVIAYGSNPNREKIILSFYNYNNIIFIINKISTVNKYVKIL